MSKFLHSTGDGNDVTDGSTDILAATLAAVNLKTSLPVKTDAGKVLYSTLLDIADVDGLSTSITGALKINGTNAMTAPLKAPDGTVALPSYTFTSDLDTGISTNAGDLLLSSAGVEALRCTGSTVSVAGVLSMNANLIQEVADPISTDDAATKSYVDAAVADEVKGPATAVDSNLCAFDGTTGELIKDSGIELAAYKSLILGSGESTNSTKLEFQNTSANQIIIPNNESTALTIGYAGSSKMIFDTTNGANKLTVLSELDLNSNDIIDVGDVYCGQLIASSGITTAGAIDQTGSAALIIGSATATSVDIATDIVDTNIKGDLTVGYKTPFFPDNATYLGSTITKNNTVYTGSTSTDYRFGYSETSFIPGTTTTNYNWFFKPVSNNGNFLEFGLVQEDPVPDPNVIGNLGTGILWYFLGSIAGGMLADSGGVPTATVNDVASTSVASNDIFEARVSNTCTDIELYYHGQTRTSSPLLIYSVLSITNTSVWRWRFGDNSSASTAFVIELLTPSLCDVGGDLLVGGSIDQIAGQALKLGPTTATSIELGSATINTGVKGALVMTGTIDQASAATLQIGVATATLVELGASDADVSVLGDLIVSNMIDTVGASPIAIGLVNSNGIEISRSGINTVIQGDLRIDEGVVVNDIDTLSGVALNIGAASATSIELGASDITTQVLGDFKHDTSMIEQYRDITIAAPTTSTSATPNTAIAVNLDTDMLTTHSQDMSGTSAGVVTFSGTRTNIIQTTYNITFHCDKKSMPHFYAVSSNTTRYPGTQVISSGPTLAAGAIPASVVSVDYDTNTSNDDIVLSCHFIWHADTSDTITLYCSSDVATTVITIEKLNTSSISLSNTP